MEPREGVEPGPLGKQSRRTEGGGGWEAEREERSRGQPEEDEEEEGEEGGQGGCQGGRAGRGISGNQA